MEREHCIALETPERTFFVSGESHEDTNDWLNAICRSITANTSPIALALAPEDPPDGQDDDFEILPTSALLAEASMHGSNRNTIATTAISSAALDSNTESRPRIASLNPIAKELLG
eukprot:c14819_g1_i1.p1 GENE.c14819_g1_i1~~c14819_g1_i1.p1  ORF type:complete len:116 (+),score=24.66 c14819_g1_i1:757-1104(+)